MSALLSRSTASANKAPLRPLVHSIGPTTLHNVRQRQAFSSLQGQPYNRRDAPALPVSICPLLGSSSSSQSHRRCIIAMGGQGARRKRNWRHNQQRYRDEAYAASLQKWQRQQRIFMRRRVAAVAVLVACAAVLVWVVRSVVMALV
jgi:hypothetical protein